MSYQRAVSVLVMLPTLWLVSGCYSTLSLRPSELDPDGEVKGNINGVLTRRGEQISFDEPAVIERDSIRAEVDRQPYSVALEEVAMIKVRHFDTAKTVILSVVVIGTIVAFAIAASNMKFVDDDFTIKF